MTYGNRLAFKAAMHCLPLGASHMLPAWGEAEWPSAAAMPTRASS